MAYFDSSPFPRLAEYDTWTSFAGGSTASQHYEDLNSRLQRLSVGHGVSSIDVVSSQTQGCDTLLLSSVIHASCLEPCQIASLHRRA